MTMCRVCGKDQGPWAELPDGPERDAAGDRFWAHEKACWSSPETMARLKGGLVVPFEPDEPDGEST